VYAKSPGLAIRDRTVVRWNCGLEAQLIGIYRNRMLWKSCGRRRYSVDPLGKPGDYRPALVVPDSKHPHLPRDSSRRLPIPCAVQLSRPMTNDGNQGRQMTKGGSSRLRWRSRRWVLPEEEPVRSTRRAYALPFFATPAVFAPATSQGRFGLVASGVSRSFTRS